MFPYWFTVCIMPAHLFHYDEVQQHEHDISKTRISVLYEWKSEQLVLLSICASKKWMLYVEDHEISKELLKASVQYLM